MTTRIAILAGAANSGKTTTLRQMTSRFRQISEHLFETKKGRRLVVYFSSPQEQCKNARNCAECANNLIDSWLEECRESRATLLVMPFTMSYRGSIVGDFNEDCVRTPIERLRRRAHDVHLVYLNRRQRVRQRQAEMDNLMSDLGSELTIISEDHQADRQADEFWDHVRGLPW